MPFKFNPFSGNFDQTGSGGGASYIDGEVAAYGDLSLDAGVAPLNSAWLVRSASGVWPVSRKQAGIYIRTATGGVSRDADFTYAGTMPDVFSDAVLTIYDEASTTRTGQFNLGSVTAGQNRVLTWPDGNGTIARTSDIPSTFAASAITSGVLDNARINFAAPAAIGSTTASTGAFTTLSANNGTLTASAPVLDLAQTWNNAAVTFTGLRFNVTNTASAAASLLADIQLGGTTLFGVNRDGTIGRFNASTGATRSGIFFNGQSANRITITAGDSTVLYLAPDDVGIAGGAQIRWDATGGAPTGTGTGLALLRDGANHILAQRVGTNPQTFRLYNTYTDASNYERAKIAWSSNVLQIGTEKGGTGSARALEFQTDGVTRWTITTAGLLTTSPADSGGFILSNGWMNYRAGTTNHWAVVSGNITNRSTGFFQWSGGSDASNFSGDTLRLSRPSGGALLLEAGATTTHRFLFGGTTSSFPALKRDSTTLQVRLADDSAFAPLSCGALTLNGNLDASTRDIVTDTTTGTKIGTGTTQKIGFFNATPVVQQAAVADATDAASTQARLNDLLAAMRSLGLIAT